MKKILTKFGFVALLSLFAQASWAHMLWLERADNGNSLAFFGEPHEHEKEPAEKLAMFKDALLKQDNKSYIGEILADHILYESTAEGDVRLAATIQHKDMLVHFRAKNNTTQTTAQLDYELVPVDASKGIFSLVLNKKPAAEHKVLVISPDLTTQELATDAQGKLQVSLTDKGVYILEANHMEEKIGKHNNVEYKKVIYVSTLSFTHK